MTGHPGPPGAIGPTGPSGPPGLSFFDLNIATKQDTKKKKKPRKTQSCPTAFSARL